jgi:hypothetical protein
MSHITKSFRIALQSLGFAPHIKAGEGYEQCLEPLYVCKNGTSGGLRHTKSPRVRCYASKNDGEYRLGLIDQNHRLSRSKAFPMAAGAHNEEADAFVALCLREADLIEASERFERELEAQKEKRTAEGVKLLRNEYIYGTPVVNELGYVTGLEWKLTITGTPSEIVQKAKAVRALGNPSHLAAFWRYLEVEKKAGR